MLPRRLNTLAQAPKNQRIPIIAEGVAALAESVSVLEADAAVLGEAGRVRGMAALRCFAEEEAAKVLILLDLVRAGWRDQLVVRDCLDRFYDHLARGLYVQAYDGSPATLGEVRRYLDGWRQEYYLDGPTDVDWIFGNEVITAREQRLYVDYIEEENGQRRWTGPAERAAVFDEPFTYATPTSQAVQLVAAMRKIGLLTEPGLAATQRGWSGRRMDDATHWSELHPVNLAVVTEIIAASPTTVDTDAARYVVEHWIFPLTTLDLSLSKVDIEDLQKVRNRWLAREFGIDDQCEY